MTSRWYRNRYTGVAAILLAASAGVFVLRDASGSEAKPPDLRTQLTDRLRGTLEKSDPGQHNHAGHSAAPITAPVICGVHLYGFEPSTATELTAVRTVYAFHLCGVAEPKSPWDVAVKLAGPVIVDMSADPPGIRPVEATADVRFIDRLRQMFPSPYAELAQKEALSSAEMTELRRRYDEAAGL
ncbi:hypothetical protein AB0J83_02045 [Actinoplanes sp. NPDC049596]|uniref:hypothetical protein n=1 Tax=unclassified Actinoplanes TaxID=2626549 RepID=UPI00342338BE